MTAPQILRDRAVTFSGKVQRFLKQNVGGAVMPAPYVVTVNQENPPSVPEGDTIIVNCPLLFCPKQARPVSIYRINRKGDQNLWQTFMYWITP